MATQIITNVTFCHFLFSDEHRAKNGCQPPTSSCKTSFTLQPSISDATVSVQPTLSIASSTMANAASTLSNALTTTTPPPTNLTEWVSHFHSVSIAEAVAHDASLAAMSNASMSTSNYAVASTSDNATNVLPTGGSVVPPVDQSTVNASSSTENVVAHSLVDLQEERLNVVTASFATSLPSPARSPLDLSTSSSRSLFFRINEDSSNDSGFALRGSPPVVDDDTAPRSRSSSIGSLSLDGESSASETSVLSISVRRQPIAREAKRPVSYADDAPQANSNPATSGRGAAGKRKAGAGGKRRAGAGGKRGAGAGGKGGAGAGEKRGAGAGGSRGGKTKDNMEEPTKGKPGLQDNFSNYMNTFNKTADSRLNFSGRTDSNAENNRMSSIDPPAFV